MVAQGGQRRPFDFDIGEPEPGAVGVAQLDLARPGAGRKSAVQPFHDHFAAACLGHNPFDQAMAGRGPEHEREKKQDAAGNPAAPARDAQQSLFPLLAQKACPSPI
jgi:hypothetical protein